MTKMTDLFERQGLPPGEDWGEYAKAKVARRNKNLAAAHEVLTRNQITYRTNMHDERFFIVQGNDGTEIHYLPEIGEWWFEQGDETHRGFGVRNLVRLIKGKVD